MSSVQLRQRGGLPLLRTERQAVRKDIVPSFLPRSFITFYTPADSGQLADVVMSTLPLPETTLSGLPARVAV